MKTILIISCLIFLNLTVFSGGDNRTYYKSIEQDPKYILEQLKQFYISHEYVHHELKYYLYADQTSAIPHSIEDGTFIRKGKHQYARLASIESLTTNEYSIGIDRDEKVIMISNLIHLPATDPMTQLENTITSDTEIEVHDVSPDLRELLIVTAYGEIAQARLIFNTNTYQPVKLIFGYRKSIQLSEDIDAELATPRLEVEYTRTDFGGGEKYKLDINRYLIQRGEEWMVAPEYHDFELINNIHPYPDQN